MEKANPRIYTKFDTSRMKKGFTLIELLVSISIIGLIASIALANLQEARQRAREASGKQFHTTIRSGLGDKVASMWELNDSIPPGGAGRPGEGEEGPETLIHDSSGNGRTGHAVGVEGSDDGAIGSSLYFDGESYVWGEGFYNPGNDGNFTVSVWIKPANITTEQTIFAIQDDGSGECKPLEIGIYAGDATVNGVPTTGLFDVINNVWQNLAFSFRTDPIAGPVVDTYINGKKIGTTDSDVSDDIATSDCPNANWSIGSSIDFSGGSVVFQEKGFLGLIDSVNIYEGSF